jgi:hypothetical protein
MLVTAPLTVVVVLPPAAVVRAGAETAADEEQPTRDRRTAHTGAAIRRITA